MSDFQPLAFQTTSIAGLIQITPQRVDDKRGFFLKTFEKSIFEAHNISFSPYEELRSKSSKGVVRGLHFQYHHCQEKLVHVLAGAAYDVAVDLRQGSPSFGKWAGFLLSTENQSVLYIPKGCAHGFLALDENTLFSYLSGEPYDPATESGIRWDDPSLSIDWPLDQVGKIILSEKDAALPTFSEFLDKTGGRGLEGI